MPKSGASGGTRPKLVLVSEETRHMCVLLAQELVRWPDVNIRSMFGMRAFYRRTVVFAMLPDKRGLESPKAIAYKLPSRGPSKEGEKWKLFELENEQDIGTALAHLGQAYRKAVGSTRNG